MYSSAKYQMDFLEKLAFNRYGGTEDERKAAELISEEVKRLGGSSQIEEFTIRSPKLLWRSSSPFTVLLR